VGLDTLMGVLGASGNALYCCLVSVTPIPDTAPNGLSSRPRWGRFFVRRTNEGSPAQWKLTAG